MAETLSDQSFISAPDFDAYRARLELANQELQQEIAERRRVEAELRAYAARLNHLHSSQLAILSAQSFEDTLDITIRHIKNTLPCLSTTIVVYDFEQAQLEVLRSDRVEFVPGWRLPIIMWQAIGELRRGNYFYIADVQEPPGGYPGMQSAAQIGGRSVLMIPIRYREELIGSLTVTAGEIHQFSQEELVIAREIASSLAIAIQNHRWLQAEQDAREREAMLREVAESLTSDLEIDVVLRQILTQLERLVRSASSAIFLVDEGRMRVVASRAIRTKFEALEQFVATFPDFMREMMATGQARIIGDTHNDDDWVVIEGGEYIRSWMGIPLMVKGRGIGVLTLDRELVNSFEQQDLETAQILANQAAVAIENARLFRREQEYAVQLEREVRERTKELQVLYDISAAAAENLELGLLLRFSLNQTLNVLGYSAGVVHLLNEDGSALVQAAAVGFDKRDRSFALPEQPAGEPLLQQLRQAIGPWSVFRSELWPLDIGDGFMSCVVAPLRAHGRLVGALTLLSPAERPLLPDTQTLLTTIADQIGLAVESTELRRRIRQTAVLSERERIARDLHDVVTQSLYSLILFAEAARESAAADDMAEVQKNMQKVMRAAQRALGEMRMLLYDLRSETMASQGLVEVLSNRLATVEERAGLAAELVVNGDLEIPPALEEVLYRVALEALNNTLRHAAAKRVTVTLEMQDGAAAMTVADDGMGFVTDVDGHGPGMGLTNMRRRVQNAGGLLQLRSMPGEGTRIDVRIPVVDHSRETGPPLS